MVALVKTSSKPECTTPCFLNVLKPIFNINNIWWGFIQCITICHPSRFSLECNTRV